MREEEREGNPTWGGTWSVKNSLQLQPVQIFVNLVEGTNRNFFFALPLFFSGGAFFRRCGDFWCLLVPFGACEGHWIPGARPFWGLASLFPLPHGNLWCKMPLSLSRARFRQMLSYDSWWPIHDVDFIQRRFLRF